MELLYLTSPASTYGEQARWLFDLIDYDNTGKMEYDDLAFLLLSYA